MIDLKLITFVNIEYDKSYDWNIYQNPFDKNNKWVLNDMKFEKHNKMAFTKIYVIDKYQQNIDLIYMLNFQYLVFVGWHIVNMKIN